MKKTKEAKNPNFMDWNNSILVSSIKKIDFNIFLIAFLDALFYIISGYAIVFWLQRVQEKMASFNVPADIMSIGKDNAIQLASEIKSFYYLIIISLLALLLAIIFLASIFKGIIWAKTTNTKISFKLISRFLALNLIWMGFWIVLLFLIAYLAERTAAPLILLVLVLLSLYFSNTVYTIFMKEGKLKSILKAIKLNISKFHLFLLPYAAIFLLFYVLMKASNLLKFKYSAILLGFVLVFYIAIVRYYVSTLVIGIEEK
ncbi:hypothetical protein HY487_00125 [Candidatus Woesearchaeota archaeon]|nr:hypothetical protein [Candidatus Woesearchaeota archaeon]